MHGSNTDCDRGPSFKFNHLHRLELGFRTDDSSDATIIQRMKDLNWEGTTSSEQKHSTPVNNAQAFTRESPQPVNHEAHSVLPF